MAGEMGGSHPECDCDDEDGEKRQYDRDYGIGRLRCGGGWQEITGTAMSTVKKKAGDDQAK